MPHFPQIRLRIAFAKGWQPASDNKTSILEGNSEADAIPPGRPHRSYSVLSAPRSPKGAFLENVSKISIATNGVTTVHRYLLALSASQRRPKWHSLTRRHIQTAIHGKGE